jgi:hypothetical protein
MGKASRRKHQSRNGGHHRRVLVTGSVPAPDFEAALIDAARLGLAMITSVHASPEDLARLIEDLDRPRQAVVAYALVSQFITESAREIAEARGLSVVAAINQATGDLYVEATMNRPALDRALTTVRIYAGVLDGVASTEAVVPDLDVNTRQRQAALSYLGALAQIAHDVIVARCVELDEDVATYLQRVSLTAAEAHSCEIDADAVEDYVDALIAERLANEPMLLTRAAEALRGGSITLSDEDIDEFCELGGSDRLAELTDVSWDDLDAEDKQLVIVVLIDCVLVASEGDTVADRVRVTWRL